MDKMIRRERVREPGSSSSHPRSRSLNRSRSGRRFNKVDENLNLLSAEERSLLNPNYHSNKISKKSRSRSNSNSASGTMNRNQRHPFDLKKRSSFPKKHSRSSSIRNVYDAPRNNHLLQTMGNEWPIST